MEEGGTELEAKAEESELEGPVRRTCEDMELEEGDTELEEGELAEEGELVGPAEEGELVGPAEEGSTELEAEAEEGELEEGELAEEGKLAGQRSWRPLSHSVFLIVQGADCTALTPPTRPLCPLHAALARPLQLSLLGLQLRCPRQLALLSLGLQLRATLLRWPLLFLCDHCVLHWPLQLDVCRAYPVQYAYS